MSETGEFAQFDKISFGKLCELSRFVHGKALIAVLGFTTVSH